MFLKLSLSAFGAEEFLVVRTCPVHHRGLSNIPGSYPLHASGTSPVGTAQNVSRNCQMSPGLAEGGGKQGLGGQNDPWLRTTA